MQRDSIDELGRSFKVHDDHQSIKSGSNNNGGGITDPRTAEQLLKLHRLVESLVIRELERGEKPANGLHEQPIPSRSRVKQSQQQTHGVTNDEYGRGAGVSRSRKSTRHIFANDSTITSLDAASMPYSSAGSDGTLSIAVDTLERETGRAGAVGRPSGHTELRAGRSGARSVPTSTLEEGVQTQVVALQEQLSLLGEQLNAAYRAAERVDASSGTGGGSSSFVRGQSQSPHLLLAGAHGSVGSTQAAVMTGLGSGGPSPYRPISPSAAAASMVALKQRQLYPAGGGGGGSPKCSPPDTRIRPSSYATLSTFRRGGAGGGGSDALGAQDGGGLGRATAAAAGGSTTVASSSLAQSSGGPASSSRRTPRQIAEDRVGREAGAQEDERLRNWIQELRLERRRLEDRLLEADPSGGAAGAQQMRDELEKQILNLARQRDQLALELEELGVTRAANVQLAGQLESVEVALATEMERVVRLKEVRPVLEGKLAEVSASLESMKRQHTAAMEALVQERDAALSKARRSAKRAAELEATTEAAQGEVRRLQDEVRSHVLSLAEIRANDEVLQSASQQMQANMEAQAKEAATRLAAVQSQLEASQSDTVILRRTLEAAQRETAVLRDQLKDGQARMEIHAAERSRLSAALAAEQRAAAAARQQVESLTAQLKAGDEARADLAKAASAQLEAVKRQHTADMAATQKQYESQLAVAEKQYLLLQRQYDAGLASNGQAAEAAAAARRERDALWAETQNLKTELEEVRSERNELSSKLTSLRVEVRGTVEEVARDREAKLAAATVQSEAVVRELKAEAEKRASSIRQDYEAKLASVMDVAEKLRAEAQEAQRQAEKYRTAAGHLKDQVRDLLLSRDAAERELASERAFNEELNRILTTLREEQQQQHQQHALLHQHQQNRLGLGLGLGSGATAIGTGRVTSPST